MEVGTVPPITNCVQKSSRKGRFTKSRNTGGVARKGIKPKGKNGELWQAKHNMRGMLEKQKLLGGEVPPTSTATPTSKNKKKLFVGAVPPTSTATPTEIEKVVLLSRAVPPPSDAATPDIWNRKELQSGTVPTRSTATLTAKRIRELFGGIVPTKSTATRRDKNKEELLSGTVPPLSTATQEGNKKIGLLWGTVPPSSLSTSTQNKETRKSQIECSTAQTSQTWNLESEVAKVKLQGKAKSQEVLFLQSEVSQARGGLHKSSKKIQLPRKVSEMRKIWEPISNVSKFTHGPEISDTSTICAKPMGGQDMPTVLGPANSAGH